MNWISRLWVRQLFAFFIAFFVLLIVLDELDQMPNTPVNAQREQVAKSLTLVKPEQVKSDVYFSALASVEPPKTLDISVIVSGQVVEVYDDFKQGTVIKQGTPLVKLDDRQYQLNVAQASASLVEAEFNLKNALATFTHDSLSVELAKTQFKVAQKALSVAKYNLSQTVISMPANGELISLKAGIGEFINVGQSIASAIEHNDKRIQLAVSNTLFHRLAVQTMAHIKVSDVNQNNSWQATLTGISQNNNHMQRLIFFSVSYAKSQELLFGDKVNVELPMKAWPNTLRMPESTLTEQNELFFVNEQGVLDKHKLTDFIKHDGWLFFNGASGKSHYLLYPRSSLLVGTKVLESQTQLASVNQEVKR